MIELERTYLAKYLPDGLSTCPSREMLDMYLPVSSRHPVLRIRKNGEKLEMTKKSPVVDGDSSKQEEQTIRLSREEFVALVGIEGKRVGKTRYLYEIDGRTAEVDVFVGALSGLVLVDFEFETEAEKDAFPIPEFCLAEVTQEEFIAGGFLAGKSYDDIAPGLARFGYERIETKY
ncbi:MAG: CYTH domain-containing protein [Candidatus Moranbacteria bacterium]|nr:CYTH domain-containing protein [Candidatus Moranbacteria bacterium]